MWQKGERSVRPSSAMQETDLKRPSSCIDNRSSLAGWLPTQRELAHRSFAIASRLARHAQPADATSTVRSGTVNRSRASDHGSPRPSDQERPSTVRFEVGRISAVGSRTNPDRPTSGRLGCGSRALLNAQTAINGARQQGQGERSTGWHYVM